jgi:hypothetical protein
MVKDSIFYMRLMSLEESRKIVFRGPKRVLIIRWAYLRKSDVGYSSIDGSE